MNGECPHQIGSPVHYHQILVNDLQHEDVIEATRLATAALGTIWGQGSPQLYQALKHTVASLPQTTEDIQKLISPLTAAVTALVPTAVVDKASKEAHEEWDAQRDGKTGRERSLNAINAFLYAILRGDQRLHQLHDQLGKEPSFLEEVAHIIFPETTDASGNLVDLVDLAVRARPTSTDLSLLPARYHAFARALEGVFACLNIQGHTDRQPHLFLKRHETCPECDGYVVELATCVRCGATYLVGRKEASASSNDFSRPQQYKLRQLTDNTRELSGRLSYFLLDEHTGNIHIDEDDITAIADEASAVDDIGKFYQFCLRCGGLSLQTGQYCSCGGVTISLREMEIKEDLGPKKCIHCGARSTNAIIFRFLTGQDAPVSVLATALYQLLPTSTDPDAADLPGEGRKLLTFSDSRQDAAFFAPYLERTYNQVLHRRLILQALLSDKDGYAGQLRLQDMVSRVLKEAESAGMFQPRQSRDERLSNAKTWLMQELISLDRRLSLEGLGLLQFRLVRPRRWRPPVALQTTPWNLNEEEAWSLIALLLDTLRQQAVTTFLDGLDPKDEQFAPRSNEFFVRKDQSDSKAGILSWIPTRGMNRRQDLLERILMRCAPDLTPEERHSLALEALSGLWNHLTDTTSPWREQFLSTTRSRSGVVYRLGNFFQPEAGLVGGPELLLALVETHPGEVQAALRRIVPADMQAAVGIEDWSWLRTADDDGMLNLLERVDAEITEDLNLYRKEEDDAARERLYSQSKHYQQVVRTIRGRSLLGFLASRNLLPKYGFPTDVVELKTDHLPYPEALCVQLERDLRIAIAEYAPGAEVVAAKRIWTGGGLYKQPRRDWPVYKYTICSECNRFLRRKAEEEIPAVCTCGNTLKPGRTFVIPEFGFVAARNSLRTPGESRLQRLYASRVYFSEYAIPQHEQQPPSTPAYEIVEALSNEHICISNYYSRFGKLVH